jgi:hypothetical protein
MPGYSGTPLAKKLGIKNGSRVVLVGMPPDVRAELAQALASCTVVKDGRGSLDFAMVFAKKQAELRSHLENLAKQLAPAGMLWMSWPKKISHVAADMNENDVRRIGLEAGLVDVKVCAVSEVWSGLKFVRRVRDRVTG